MRCQVIVLVKLSTMDSAQELDENRKSLISKYLLRSQRCIPVNYPDEKIPNLKGKGSVGVYVLSHTKDVVASVLAKQLFEQLIDVKADVRKINIACCNASGKQGPMMKFCEELEECHKTSEGKLPTGLMVCGFNVNVTTFDIKSEFMDQVGKNFKNYAEIKDKAKSQNRSVATVKQDWDKKYLHFVHEKMIRGDAPAFIQEIRQLFQQQLQAKWNEDRGNYIQNKFNKNSKNKIDKPEDWPWQRFNDEHSKWANLYVKNVFWRKFVECIRAVSPDSAAMWVSLDGYVKMKKVMKFDGDKFVATVLSEYAENEDMKQALSWVENAQKQNGLNLRFMPEV